MTAPAVADIDYASLRGLLAPRARAAHKGDFGHVLVVGGDVGLGGAALMSAEAAARAGAGLVSVATHPAHLAALLARRPELMVRGLTAPEQLQPLLARASVVVAGPGLGQGEWGRALLQQALETSAQRGLPLVLDADALNLLASGAVPPPPSTTRKWVLTPHPGEAARLLGCETTAIQADRPAAARRLRERLGGVVLLKGAGTLIAWHEDGTVRLARCRDGNPGMASGGMGDILSGVIGALLAQHHALAEAACLGACLHAASADRAAGEGERGLLATDLLPWLRRLANPEGQG